jgi:predicted nucleotidyltransferase component of viral defense system
MLHNDKEMFEQLIISTAEYFNISEIGIIEKDYYVSLILDRLSQKVSNLVFKGGTSLSKAYKIINRFSEDVDLNLYTDNGLTNRVIKDLTYAIRAVVSELGFTIENDEEINSGMKYNKFNVAVPSIYQVSTLKPVVLLETSLSVKAYPTEEKQISSLIYDYLLASHKIDLIVKYNLKPFTMQVQALKRTFVDKVFAIADYYISKDIKEHSRHLYDLYCLFPHIAFDQDIKQLIEHVRKTRSELSFCLSAQAGVNLNQILNNILAENTYKTDYNTITKSLIYDGISYSQTIEILQKIIDSNFFNSL